MVWNGRNESILGSKPSSPLAADSTPKQVGDTGSSTSTTAASSELSTNSKATSAATPPPPNAWNGRNTKIMEVRDNNISKDKEVVAGTTTNPLKVNGKKDSKSAPIAATNTNTPVVMMSVISKKPGEVLVNTTSCSSSTTTATSSTSASPASRSSSNNNINCNNKKDDNIKPHSKEDETTNSTSGSSTTNTTIEEDPTSTPPALLETTVAVAACSATSNSNNNNSEKDDSQEKTNSPSPTTADVKLPPRSNSSTNLSYNSTTNSSNHRQNNHHQQGRNGESNSHVRRGNHRGGSSSGSRGNNTSNNNNSNHQSSGKNNNSNALRGNATSSGGRRRVNKSEMPICSFFLQGQCTRGTSCNFRHDPTAQQLPASLNNNNNNNMNTTVAAVVSPSNNHRSSSRQQPASVSNSNNQYMNAMAASFVPNKRVFDPYKARAIQMAKEAQDAEDRSSFASPTTIAKQISEEVEGTGGAISEEKKTEEIEDPPFFSIDVECVATGYGSCARGINDGCGNEGRNREGVPPFQYNDRSHRYPGRVAMVDSDGNVVADIIIRPPKEGAGVLSYLTPLTGLTAESCLGQDAVSLEEAVDVIKGALPKNGVIVGQAIDHDVQWLGLTAGKDFDRMVDISEIFRQRMPSVLNEAVNAIKEKEEGGGAATDVSDEENSSDKYLGFATRYRHFSLRHVCLNLLGEDIQSGIHDPIVDAKYSLLLFHKYRNSSVTQLRIVRDGLHRAPVTPGFAAEKTPVIEGVCVSRAGYPYKRAARKIWRWYSALKNNRQD